MDDSHQSTTGTGVGEQALDPWEQGFLAGVLAAWGVRSAGHGEFRDALKILRAQRQDRRATHPPHPALRLATAKPRQPTGS